MLKKLVLTMAGLLISLSTFAGNTLACACCAEPGTYGIWTGKPEQYVVDILKQVEFDKKALLYITEAGFDSMKGLSPIEKDYFDDPAWAAGDFDLVNSFSGKVWTFNFKTPKGKTGSLRLPMPTNLVMFKVDIHDDSDHGLGPLLYKEFRFKGTVLSGSGFLGGSIINPTTYFLVFQGRGNGCDDVSDFRNFNLEITGKKARYQFYGKLKSGTGNEATDTKTSKSLSLLTLQ